MTRRVIQKLEGDNVSDEILKEYADPDSERYKICVRKFVAALNLHHCVIIV